MGDARHAGARRRAGMTGQLPAARAAREAPLRRLSCCSKKKKKKLSRRRLRLLGLDVRPCNPFRHRVLRRCEAGTAASSWSEPVDSSVVLADIERNVARQTPAVRGGRLWLCQTGEEAGESRRTSLCGRRRRGEDGGRRAAPAAKKIEAARRGVAL
ncbi:unnamed protein product, partial [Ixodes persulcatus]